MDWVKNPIHCKRMGFLIIQAVLKMPPGRPES